MLHCWAGFMNASPTTRSRLGVTLSSRRPARQPTPEVASVRTVFANVHG